MTHFDTFNLTQIRLKKVQGKKKRDAEASELAKKKLLEEQEKQEAPSPAAAPPVDDQDGPSDLLATKDQDVIF
jgi:V-type H+-transporting ATPase subunit D